MARVSSKRLTVEYEGELVIFLIGMRINKFGYPHPDSDARLLTELAIVATLWSAGEVIP